MVKGICNGLWERFRTPQESRLGTPCNTLKQSSMEDSAESSEPQNAGNHDVSDGNEDSLGNLTSRHLCYTVAKNFSIIYSVFAMRAELV